MSLGCGPAIVNRIPYVFTDGHCTATVTATVRPLYGHCTAIVQPLHGYCGEWAERAPSIAGTLRYLGDFWSARQQPHARFNVRVA